MLMRGGKMFTPKLKGYHTEIIGDKSGVPHQVLKKDVVLKAKVYEITCQGGRDHEGNPNVEVTFTIGGADGVSKSNAVSVACKKYRYVMDLAPNIHVNCRVQEVKAKIGASA